MLTHANTEILNQNWQLRGYLPYSDKDYPPMGRGFRVFQAGRGEISRRAPDGRLPLCGRVISREGFGAVSEVLFRAETHQSCRGSLFSLGRRRRGFPARARSATLG